MREVSLILLPPSEGKSSGGAGERWSSGSMKVDLDDQRLRAIRALRSAMRSNAGDRSSLLGVKGDALAAATNANRSILESPTMPAIERYTGVLYGALDHMTLPEPDRGRLDDCVLILSGLWGLVSPSDPIPDYKLKMGARLGSLGRMSTWWRGHLSDGLEVAARDRAVWNLLPKEHDSAIAPGVLGNQMKVEFLEPNKAGKLVAVSHWNKYLKGALVRHLVENPSTTPTDLADWEHPSGFRFDPTRLRHDSSTTTIAFVKNG